MVTMRIDEQIKQLIQQLGTSQISSSAYDTAWVARLTELDEPVGRGALQWLRRNQLPDGSWGASEIAYSHDRVVCTLAAMIALAKTGDASDNKRIRRARLGLDIAFQSLSADISGATVGFEAITPRLLEDAYNIGALRRSSDRFLFDTNDRNSEMVVGGRRSDIYEKLRRKKEELDEAAETQAAFINRELSAAFSAEMVGENNAHLLDIGCLQEKNGSVGCNPSATAFYALSVQPKNPKAMSYLRSVSREDGSVPAFTPLELFEIAVALWNFSIIQKFNVDIERNIQPHLDTLEECWNQEDGVGFTRECSITDGDDTFLAYDVLHAFGRNVNIKTVLNYRRESHFCCYHTEADASPSANIHALGALKNTGYSIDSEEVQGVLNFLMSQRLSEAFWRDKWHVSPYYPTSHAIIVGAGFVPNDLLRGAVAWVLDTQRQDGSWGYYQKTTAEETAYCLQALIFWACHGGNVSTDVLKRGISWLRDHSGDEHPPLWICKCLYTPKNIVRSAILSALLLGDELW